MKHFLVGDVDTIKEFVFETSSLPQIRGGSQLLVECEAEVTRRIEQLGGEKIYCSGGSFLFKVPADQAGEAKRTIEKLYLDRTLAATVTVVYEQPPLSRPFTDSPPGGWARRLWDAHQQAQRSGGFARRVAFLSARVREAKGQKREVPFFEAFPFGRRCESCGKRVASEEVLRYEPGEEEITPERVVLCQVCLRRHQEGVRGTKDKVRGRFNQEFWHFASPQAEQPPDLDHLVKNARRKYIAFLYADGNDIGRLLQQVQSENEFKALSEALEKGTQQALFEALREVCGLELRKSEDYWPFEIVNIGGDDVTLLVQAGYAWEVAVEFLQRFEEKIKAQIMASNGLGYWPQAWPERITASCGIAIADVKYPIRYLERLASDLLKEAKREAKKTRGKPQSAVTFLWLPTPIATEKVEPLMAYYGRDEAYLTARPYNLERARNLTALVREASQWPRTLRHRWGEALEKGMWVSLNTVYYDIARREDEERVQLAEFLSKVGQLAGREEFRTEAPAPLWQPYQEDQRPRWRTALLDVLELAELRAVRPDVKEEEE